MPTTAQSFDAFRVELDDYNDRRERLIKVLLASCLANASFRENRIGKPRCHDFVQESYIPPTSNSRGSDLA